MSELVYVDYLKEVNKNLVANDVDLNLDFEIGTTHIIEQLGVLEQYLTLNNLALQVEQEKGIPNLLGFPEMTEDVWQNIHRVEEQKKLKRIRQQNKLFERGTPCRLNVVMFNTDSINDYEEPEIEETDETETVETALDADNIDIFDDLENDSDSEGIEKETISPSESESELDEPFPDLDSNLEEDEEDESLLSNVFSDLQKAQALFSTDDDLDFKDEYAILDEDLSDYKNMTQADNEDEDIDDTEEEIEEDEEYTEGFSFETPSFDSGDNQDEEDSFEGFDIPRDIDETPPVTIPPHSNQMNRDEVLTDKMVDKTTDVINKGLNALLKKIAK